MSEKSLEAHWNTICSSIELALRGQFPMGLEAIEAHVSIKASLEAISKVLEEKCGDSK